MDEFDPAPVPDVRGFLARDIDEGLRPVDVCGARETPAEQLVMDDADSTADVQDCFPCPWPLTQGPQQPTCRWQGPTAMIVAQIPPGARAIELVRTTRAVDDTLARARHYGQRAIDALGIFANGKAKDAMIEAVEFAIARAY